MQITPKQKNRGFTLIEMLLSIALFSIVLTISMGAIFTIIDSNRKTQTLTLTMNNLSFAIESMTRDLKTADPKTLKEESVDGVNNLRMVDQDGNYISYRLNNGTIEKSVDEGDYNTNYNSIISEDVIIENFYFAVVEYGEGSSLQSTSNEQPRATILIEGYAEITERIRSDFVVQTTVSPRQLDI